MNLTLKEVEGFTAEQALLITESARKMPDVLNWKDWQDEVSRAKFSQSKGLMGVEILRLLDQSEVEINCKQFHSLSNTIAYTFLHGKLINLNDYYLAQYLQMDLIEGQSQVSSTILHEVMHEFGFTHTGFWNKMNTVPYKMQHIFQKAFITYYNL